MDNALPNMVNISSVFDAVKKKTSQAVIDANIKRICVKNSDQVDDNSMDVTSMANTKDATLSLQRLFQFIGFRMPQRHRAAYIIYSIVMNLVSCIFFPVSCIISYWRLKNVSYADINIVLVMTSVQLFFNLLASDLKLMTLVLMRHKWRLCYPVMARLDERCRQSAEEMNEVRLLVRQGNRWVASYMTIYMSYGISTAIGAYFNDQPPFNIYLPNMDYRKSTAQLWFASWIELLLVVWVIIQQVYNDSFSVTHICILRSHMRILLLRFAKLGSASLSLEQNYEALKQCIRDHKTYLELYNIIAPIVQTTVFIQFTLIAIILSMSLVSFMIIATDISSRVGTFCYIASCCMQVVPVCYNAQCLIDDSNRLPLVIFHSNWIDQDVRYRKMLIFLMQRTQSTKDLMAGKLFPINLSCCLSIIKFSFTLFTFIKTMGLEEKLAMLK